MYLEGEEPSVEQIKAAIRKGVISNTFTAVVCGTSFKNKGVQPLLDAVVDYLPSPLDVPAIDGFKPGDESVHLERQPSDDEPLSILAFKVAADPHLGKLTFVRVYSGVLQAGSQVLNSTKGRKERIGKIYQMHANKREEIDSIGAGMICAVMGLKDTTTGETLCDPNNPIVLESMTFPNPVIEQAIEPKTKSDQEKLGTAIQRLAEEDPTFRVHTDEETGQTIIAGMGELHLDVLIDRMRREFKVEANIGKPQVAYRETLRRKVEKIEYTHKKQTGGSGQFGRVIIDLEPTEPGSGYEFVNAVTGGRIPREYIPAVDQGIQEAMQFGVLAGYPVDNIKRHPDRRRLPRRRLLGAGVQARRRPGVQGGRPQGRPGHPRADDGRRGDHARGLPRHGHRRPELASWPDPVDGRAARQPRRPPSCRCRRCSATSVTCARRPRARRRTPWSSTPTPRRRATSPRRSSPRRRASELTATLTTAGGREETPAGRLASAGRR